jgi:hypothetical protein
VATDYHSGGGQPPQNFTDNASIQAPSVDITASAGDVVIASGNNLTLTVKNDRIVVDGDIDLGQINAASTTIIETSTTTDNYIDIQDGLNIEVTGGSLGSQGAPDSNCSRRCFVYLRCIVDTYLRKFKSSDASGRTFYTNNVFDSVKYARTNQIFHKGILFNVRNGYRCRWLQNGSISL